MPLANVRPIVEPLYGAIEAGGTKFVCSVARDVDSVVAEALISTTSPADTFAQVVQFFADARRRHGVLSAIGIAAFGPLDLDARSSDYGRLRATPKPGWSHTSFLEPILALEPGCPIAIDTDVNAAAVAEVTLGAAKGCSSAVYVTVGTGIGGGAMVDGRTLRGTSHPEMGHIHVRRHPHDKEFAGMCPFHVDCLEGLASGPAILARWGRPLSQLGREHHAHRIIGNYLGQLAATISLMIAPQRIVFGGGVMKSEGLLHGIRAAMRDTLAGYHPTTDAHGSIEELVYRSELDGRAGLLGALLLAKQAAVGRRGPTQLEDDLHPQERIDR